MTEHYNHLRAALGRARIFTFNRRQVMSWPDDICERYGIDESAFFEIYPEEEGFRLVLRRDESSLLH